MTIDWCPDIRGACGHWRNARMLQQTSEVIALNLEQRNDASIDTFIWSHGDAWLNQHMFRVDAHSPGERTFVVATLKYLRPGLPKLRAISRRRVLGT